jgi:hypothetical protein
VVNSTGRFTPGNEHRCPLNRSLIGPQRKSERFGEEKNLLNMPASSNPSPGHCSNYTRPSQKRLLSLLLLLLLLLSKYLIYVLYMTEDINLMQFLSLIFYWVLNPVHLPWTLLVYEFPLGTSETFICFMSVHPIKIVPPAGV